MVELHETILDNLNEIIHIVDNKINVLFINQSINKISPTTINREKVLGKNLFEIFPFLISHGIKKEYEKVFSTGKTLETKELIKINGNEYHILTTKIPILDKKRQVTHVVTVLHDITSRVKAEEELRESESRYNGLFDRSTSCIYLYDLEGNFIDANASALNLLGYTKNDIKNINIRMVVDQRQLKKLEKNVQYLLKHGISKSITEYKLRTKDGQWVWIEADASVLYKKGKPYAVQGLARDISYRKNAESELKKSEERFRDLVEKAEIGILIDDKERNTVYFNRQLANLFGYSHEEMKKKQINSIIHPEDLEKIKKYHFNRVNNKKSPKRYEFKGLKKDGSVAFLEVSAVALRKDDEIIGTRSYMWDITQRKKIEESLQHSEKNFRMLIENAHDAIYIITAKGFSYVNPAFEKLTGYTSTEIQSPLFKFWDLIYEKDRELISKREDARKKGKKIPNRYNFRIKTKQEEIRNVEVATVNIGKKGEIKVMGILRDITEQKKAEKELTKLSQLYATIGMSINKSDNIRVLCKKIIKDIMKVLEIEYSNIYAYSKEESLLSPIAYDGYPTEIAKKVIKPCQLKSSERWEVVKACLSMKERHVKDLLKHNPLKDNWPLYKKYNVRELFTIPLITKNNLLGVLQVAASSTNPLSNEKKRLLIAISQYVAAGIAKITAEEDTYKALEQEREFKLKTAHHFFNPIAIAKGYVSLVVENIEDGNKRQLEDAIKAIERVETVIKNIVMKGEIGE